MSICNTCYRPLESYNWYKSSKLKNDKICKRCRSISYTEYRKQYYLDNKEKMVLKNYLYRIKQKLKTQEVM